METGKLFEGITLDKAVGALAELVKTPSVSRDEGRLAELLMNKCKSWGYDAYIDRHGNMTASKKYAKNGIKFALNSHMDTVEASGKWTEDPFGARVTGGLMYGLGACDCKASIAAMLLALEAIAKSGADLRGELCFTAVVQEEVQGENNKGTVKLIKDGFDADMVVVGEPTNLKICRGCAGMVEVEVTAHGIPAHASNPEKGVNAIENMVKVISEVKKIKPDVSELLGSGAINIGVINGGLRSSVVPDICKLKIGRFVVEGESGPQFLEQVNGIIASLKAQDDSFSASAELTYNSAAGVIPEDSAVIGILKEATRELNGKETEVVGMRAHLDSDFLINMKNIPSAALGPGITAFAHLADESVPVEQVVSAAKIYALTILKALSV